MQGFREYYGWQLVAATVAVGVTLVIVVFMAVIGHQRRLAWRRPAAIVLLVGFIAMVILATLVPHGLNYHRDAFGSVTWGLTGDIRDNINSIQQFPDTLASVLVIANVALYIPVGVAAVLAGSGRMLPAVAVCCLLSVTVEMFQFVLGIGAATTDDVLLNGTGGLLGAAGMALIFRRLPHGARSVRDTRGRRLDES